MSSSNFILASQSPQRAELLHTLGVEFKVLPADIDELAIDHHDHHHRAALVAAAKASKIAEQYPLSAVVAADTFILLGDTRYEKPTSMDEARSMLLDFAGQKVEVLTGVAWFAGNGQSIKSATITSWVTFRSLSVGEIELYISKRPVTTWAGGFSLKEIPGLALASSIEGSISAVLGLPLEWVQPHLIEAGLMAAG